MEYNKKLNYEYLALPSLIILNVYFAKKKNKIEQKIIKNKKLILKHYYKRKNVLLNIFIFNKSKLTSMFYKYVDSKKIKVLLNR